MHNQMFSGLPDSDDNKSDSFEFSPYDDPSLGFILNFGLDKADDADFGRVRGYMRAFWTRVAVRIVAGVQRDEIKKIVSFPYDWMYDKCFF